MSAKEKNERSDRGETGEAPSLRSGSLFDALKACLQVLVLVEFSQVSFQRQHVLILHRFPPG